ncbi:MAG: hypothetical protein ABIN24_10030 [Dyadobacter sp.]
MKIYIHNYFSNGILIGVENPQSITLKLEIVQDANENGFLEKS